MRQFIKFAGSQSIFIIGTGMYSSICYFDDVIAGVEVFGRLPCCPVLADPKDDNIRWRWRNPLIK
jgi:hypothetical protein